MALKTVRAPIPQSHPTVSPLPACPECGSNGPFGIGKPVTLPAGQVVVPVVCRTCGDVRLVPAELVQE